MLIKYEVDINNNVITLELKKITNQIYKLLPNREEGLDWEIPLQTVMEELAGMSRLLIGKQDLFFPLMCKLEGLFVLQGEDNFFAYRRTIFECLSLINSIIKSCQV